MRKLILFTVLTACSSSDGSSDPAPDAGNGGPDMTYRHYIIDKLVVPSSNAQAQQYGMDLDSDGAVDNQLGSVVASLSAMGLDANVTVTQSIDRGDTILLARIGTTSFVDAPVATFQTYAGADPTIPPCGSSTDKTCRRHLAGTAGFTASATPAGSALSGSFVAGNFTGSAGELVVRIALLGSEPIDVVLVGSRVKLAMASDTEIKAATFAGAVMQTDIDAKVMPAVRDNMMVGVTRDCSALTSPPGCGCTTSSDGKMAIGLFDKSPQDCSISLAEIRNNSLIQSLLAPDVSIDGMMALSLGVTATAVSAQFTAP